MKNWKTSLVAIKEVKFDYDLHNFEVFNLDGDVIGTIYPPDIDAMNELIAELNKGACPIADGWEDGNGNTCTLSGWAANSGN